mmetsp:Transcript_47250/g.117955  ORF Transcript_47250/g.117955 Transcript_47250/m.117955 type:complete len:168 (-) Transcript_47250:1866-2369(-)
MTFFLRFESSVSVCLQEQWQSVRGLSTVTRRRPSMMVWHIAGLPLGTISEPHTLYSTCLSLHAQAQATDIVSQSGIHSASRQTDISRVRPFQCQRVRKARYTHVSIAPRPSHACHVLSYSQSLDHTNPEKKRRISTTNQPTNTRCARSGQATTHTHTHTHTHRVWCA